MIINIDETHRIRKWGERNWVIERRMRRDGAKWRGESFFQTLASALSWVYEHEAIAAPVECDLAGAIEAAREIAQSVIDRASAMETLLGKADPDPLPEL